jgi:selenophosphate synthetase-related protein
MWGESLGRFIVAVAPEKEQEFTTWMAGHPITVLGEVVEEPILTITDGYTEIASTNVEAMVTSWQSTLDMTGGVE